MAALVFFKLRWMAGGKSGEVAEEERIKAKGRVGYLVFFKKWLKITKKNLNFSQKGSNCKKLKT